MLFAHGFGCDQAVWRYLAPVFADRYRVVLFDHMGAGQSDVRAYEPEKYSTLEGYAGDVGEICEALGIGECVFVGHSTGAMMGLLAAKRAPGLFSRLVMIGPSPCYLNDGEYAGGFERGDIEELMAILGSNYLGRPFEYGPAAMPRMEHPELGTAAPSGFCRMDPEIARQFGRVAFLSDWRGDLDGLRVPALIVQSTGDVVAPVTVGRYLHERLGLSMLVELTAKGHCPQLSAPEAVVAAMEAYLNS